MARRKFKERYILFDQEEHENIQWEYEKTVIDRAVEYWEQEYSIESIAKMLKLDEFNVLLILMDQMYIDKLKARKSGLLRGRAIH